MGRLRYVIYILLLAVIAVSAVYSAYRNGLFAWGVLGYSSFIPYLLVLGLAGSMLIIVRGLGDPLTALSFGLFIGYVEVLRHLEPGSFSTSRDATWFLDFIAVITGGTVVAAGWHFEKMQNARKAS